MQRTILVICSSLMVSAAMAQTRTAESPVERAFADAKKNPPALRAFLAGMPKGSDLHTHLTGAVYAENFIDAASHDLLCVDKTTMTIVANKGTTRTLPQQPVCGEGTVPASDAYKDQAFYDALVDALSMRAFVPHAGVSGHDQFFATFDRFDAVPDSENGRWVDELATRAAAQNEQYLEIMHTPNMTSMLKLADTLTQVNDYAKARETLLANGMKDVLAEHRADFDSLDNFRNEHERCGTAAATPVCKVQVRYLFQVLRAFSPAQVFTQTLLGFEIASVDPRVVGINFVMPEDSYGSMSQYHEQMKLIGYLHAMYPKVHISLHAGELTLGMVPPEGLRFHIREAVEVAHAERIGHGVDVMYEDDANGLLREMATKHVMVEINLTSNDVILGVKGKDHPLANYRGAHVPVALSTDDEGVSRIDITNEYERAVLEQGLGYKDLKTMARTGLEHSFLAGESLWASPDDFSHARSGCMTNMQKTSSSCAAFLATSEKATQQWELEQRSRIFEAGFATPK